jgi:hypothetical protein
MPAALPPLPIGRMLALCGELIESAARDLETWQARTDVNWPAAGQAALADLQAVSGYLERVRAEIMPALLMNDARNRAREVDLPDPGRRVPGNSGPGF